MPSDGMRIPSFWGRRARRDIEELRRDLRNGLVTVTHSMSDEHWDQYCDSSDDDEKARIHKEHAVPVSREEMQGILGI